MNLQTRYPRINITTTIACPIRVNGLAGTRRSLLLSNKYSE